MTCTKFGYSSVSSLEVIEVRKWEKTTSFLNFATIPPMFKKSYFQNCLRHISNFVPANSTNVSDYLVAIS